MRCRVAESVGGDRDGEILEETGLDNNDYVENFSDLNHQIPAIRVWSSERINLIPVKWTIFLLRENHCLDLD